jgi:hypothetical protein
MENCADDKRKRSSNWDSSEITLLQQLVQENMSTLRSKLTNSVTNSRNISIWKNIAVQINSLGLHYRTDKEVKIKWQNMQTITAPSAISWRSVLVVEEAGENHRPWTGNWRALSLAAASRVHPFCNLQSRARTHTVLVIGLYAPITFAISVYRQRKEKNQ